MKRPIKTTLIGLIAFGVFICLSFLGLSQTSSTEKRIILTISKESIETVLAKMSQKTGVNFSYNSDIIPLDSIVSFSANNISLSNLG